MARILAHKLQIVIVELPQLQFLSSTRLVMFTSPRRELTECAKLKRTCFSSGDTDIQVTSPPISRRLQRAVSRRHGQTQRTHLFSKPGRFRSYTISVLCMRSNSLSVAKLAGSCPLMVGGFWSGVRDAVGHRIPGARSGREMKPAATRRLRAGQTTRLSIRTGLVLMVDRSVPLHVCDGVSADHNERNKRLAQ